MQNQLETFAKIFPVAGGQVLVFKDYDAEDDVSQIRLMVSTKAMFVNIALGFKNQQSRENIFEQYDQAMAEKFYKSITTTL